MITEGDRGRIRRLPYAPPCQVWLACSQSTKEVAIWRGRSSGRKWMPGPIIATQLRRGGIAVQKDDHLTGAGLDIVNPAVEHIDRRHRGPPSPTAYALILLKVRRRCFAARSTNNGMKSRTGLPSNSRRLSATARSTVSADRSVNFFVSRSAASAIARSSSERFISPADRGRRVGARLFTKCSFGLRRQLSETIAWSSWAMASASHSAVRRTGSSAAAEDPVVAYVLLSRRKLVVPVAHGGSFLSVGITLVVGDVADSGHQSLLLMETPFGWLRLIV
jgi:hypothetical protein